MKKYLLSLAMLFTLSSAIAQSEKLEPEFIGQVVVVNADSTTTLLQKEATKMKTSSTKFGYIPLPGTSLLDKSKVNMTVKGKESYLVVIENAEPGEYAFTTTDVSYVSTFGVE